MTPALVTSVTMDANIEEGGVRRRTDTVPCFVHTEFQKMFIGQLGGYVQMIPGYRIVELGDEVREGDKDMSYLPTEVMKTMTEY